MTTDLIVDFPRHQRKSRAVHFAELAQLHIFERQHAARHELSYTSVEYDLMKLVRRNDLLKVRAARNSREADHDETASTKESVCLMGIEHLLTPACINEVRSCRARCIQAVLTASEARGCWLGQNCIRLDCSDKEGQTESEEAWSASPRIGDSVWQHPLDDDTAHEERLNLV